MDFDTITQLAASAGFDSSLLAKIAIASIIANAIGRAIPDKATGALAVIRAVAKVIGLYVPNRITNYASTTSVAERLIDAKVIQPRPGDQFAGTGL